MSKNSPPLLNDLHSIMMEMMPDQKNYFVYSQQLQSCLPEKWQQRVVLGKIERGRWFVWVANAVEAQQLRFLAEEIESLLKEKLPFPPKLVIVPRPDVWQEKAYQPKSQLYPQKHLTDAEADEILERFFASFKAP